MPLVDQPNAPLKLADGSIVYPDGTVIRVDESEQADNKPRFIEIPTNVEAQQLVVNTRRKLSDLPEVPKTMNAISVILSYTLFGLDDDEIAIATGMTVEQINRMRMSDPYSTMLEGITRSIIDSDTANIRDLFSKHARDAVGVVVESLTNGRRAERLMAAKDLLDRAGHRPSDVVEHRHRMDGGLTIEIIRRERHDDVPTIEMGVE